MSTIYERDLEVASQMDVEATLEVVESKEMLHKSLGKEVVAVDESAVISKKVASDKEKLSDAVVDETDAIKEDVTATKRLTTAKKKNTEKVRANSKASDTELVVSDELAEVRKQRLKTEKDLNKHQPLIDYTPKLNDLNKEVMEELLKKIKGLKQSNQSYSREHYANDKYTKQAEKEYAHRYGLFRRINKGLEKTAKKSESGLARAGSKAMLGAGGMISEKIDDFMGSIDGIGPVYKGIKMVRESMRDAKEAKTKRLVRERASELRAGARTEKKSPIEAGDFAKSKEEREKTKEQSENKRRDKEAGGKFDKMIEILEGIRQAQIFGTLINIATKMGEFAAQITGSIGRLFTKLGPMAAAASAAIAGGAAAAMRPGTPATTVPEAPEKPKEKYKDRKKPSAKAPKPTRAPEPGPKPKTPKAGNKAVEAGAKGLFQKVGKFAASGAGRVVLGSMLRLAGPIGMAYTAYEGYKMLDESGALDGVKEKFGNMISSASDQFDGALSSLMGDDDKQQAESSIDEAGRVMDEQSKEPTGWGNDPEGTRVTNRGNIYGPGDEVKFEPGEKFISGTFDEVDKMIDAETKRRESEKIEKTAEATAGAVSNVTNVNNISNTTVNGSTGSGGSTVAPFGNEYQTPYQRGSMIQR